LIRQHRSFKDFVETEVKHLAAQRRLDGSPSGPHGASFARFLYKGRVWQINADSLVAPILRAYESDEDPLIEVCTRSGRRALRLKRAYRTSQKVEVYIYEYPN
jgi:hypothetical protein